MISKLPQKSHIFSISFKNCNIVIAFFHSESVQREFKKKYFIINKDFECWNIHSQEIDKCWLFSRPRPTYMVKTTLVLIPLFISKELLKVISGYIFDIIKTRCVRWSPYQLSIYYQKQGPQHLRPLVI